MKNPKLKTNGLCSTQVDKKDSHVWWILISTIQLFSTKFFSVEDRQPGTQIWVRLAGDEWC